LFAIYIYSSFCKLHFSLTLVTEPDPSHPSIPSLAHDLSPTSPLPSHPWTRMCISTYLSLSLHPFLPHSLLSCAYRLSTSQSRAPDLNPASPHPCARQRPPPSAYSPPSSAKWRRRHSLPPRLSQTPSPPHLPLYPDLAVKTSLAPPARGQIAWHKTPPPPPCHRTLTELHPFYWSQRWLSNSPLAALCEIR
jgi:hypothetical protein